MARIAVLLAVILALGGCAIDTPRTVRGNGVVVTEERAVSGVTGVELATLGDLTIVLGEAESLLKDAGFEVGREDLAGGYFSTVRFQSVDPGEMVPKGTEIILTVL